MLFFERDLELYISTVESGWSAADTVKLSILDGSSISYKTEYTNNFNYKIDPTPNRLNEKILTGYTAPEFDFVTYAKPYNDTTNDTTVEKLLLYSLTGNLGTEAPTEYTVDFASTNKLPELYLYIKFNSLIYKISNAVVKSAEYKFELNKILQISWKLVGTRLETVTEEPDIFTDYTSVSSYIKSNFTVVNLTYKYPLQGVYSKVFYDGTDYINKGTIGTSSQMTTIGSPGPTIVEKEGLSSYYFGPGNSDEGINMSIGASFLGNLYPDTGIKKFTVEFLIYWDGTKGIGSQQLISLNGDYPNTTIYIGNSGTLTAKMFADQLALGGDDYIDDFITGTLFEPFATGRWVHVAMQSDTDVGLYTLWLDGKLAMSYYEGPLTTRNKTTGVSSAFQLGQWNSNGDSFSGWITYPEITYNESNVKYHMDYSNPLHFVWTSDSNTVLLISGTNGFTDDSSYAHTVTNVNCSTGSGDIRSPGTVGVDNRVNITTSSAFNSSDWTIEFDIYYNRTSGTYVSQYLYNDGARLVEIFNNVIRVRINNLLTVSALDSQYSYSKYIYLCPKTTWFNIAIERYKGSYNLFINGKLYSGNIFGPTPNNVSGTAVIYGYTASTSYFYAMKNLRISNVARHSKGPFTTVNSYISEKQGTLPVIQGTVKLKNDVQVVDRHTLDKRTSDKLDHYVRGRETELDFSGYTKTGTLSNLELFESINTDIDIGNTPISTKLTVGKEGDPQVVLDISNSTIELPEVKIDEILTSNIKITSKKGETDNDDTVIIYKT